jgi:hypothetical protein
VKEKVMKLQIVLRFLTLSAALAAVTLIGYDGDAAARRVTAPASAPRTTEMKPARVEVAIGGIQVGSYVNYM